MRDGGWKGFIAFLAAVAILTALGSLAGCSSSGRIAEDYEANAGRIVSRNELPQRSCKR